MKQSLYESKKRAYLRHLAKLKEKCFSVSNNLNYIRFSNRKLNCLRWHNNESYSHILKKLDICISLKNSNHDFITEGIFINNSRADIIDLTDGIIYEILVSEEEKDFYEKIKKYPNNFKVIKVKVNSEKRATENLNN